MSVEGGSGLKLTAVNSHVGNTGEYGYGTYAIGDRLAALVSSNTTRTDA